MSRRPLPLRPFLCPVGLGKNRRRMKWWGEGTILRKFALLLLVLNLTPVVQCMYNSAECHLMYVEVK